MLKNSHGEVSISAFTLATWKESLWLMGKTNCMLYTVHRVHTILSKSVFSTNHSSHVCFIMAHVIFHVTTIISSNTII